MQQNDQALDRAANAIANADALLFTSGAGMGVDSGLPDFRGDQGFWTHYPIFQRLGLGIADLSDARRLKRDPHLLWGFYGHRTHLYRDATPHAGFAILRKWATRVESRHGWYVLTSNIDGHFQRSGLDRISEVHGSQYVLQCAGPCGRATWDAPDTQVSVDLASMRAADPLPACIHCGGLARPNLLMFHDPDYISDRAMAQQEALDAWREALPPTAKLVIIEVGAGIAIPSVRKLGEWWAQIHSGTLIRINPAHNAVPVGQIGLRMGGLDALQQLDERVG
ncbi:MAG: NAD-dependent deacetylase [Planctomycetota bacterium]